MMEWNLVVFCDRCSLGYRFAHPVPSMLLVEARMRQEGWYISDTTQLCARHKAAGVP